MQKKPELDPDFVDVIIQTLSVLSNVATLGSTWLMLRGQSPNPAAPPQFDESQRDNIRHTLRLLRRSLEDTFEAAESVLRVLEESRRRYPQSGDILEDSVRFGKASLLTVEEFGHLSGHLSNLENSAMQARNAARNLQIMARHTTSLAGIDISFNPDAFNAQLNSILFESRNVGEAMEKLRLAQQQAEDFVVDVEKALRRN
ncbi:hypothetical protein ACKWRH_24990 [Bradyrhizobium sp. Pa8]|uniref:hypothetical protein n=1 Tax=Bradyrhizobium sp. Pa8 TaxID=3386552 RepID=UPI00403F4899